jgi:hypothetical protein
LRVSPDSKRFIFLRRWRRKMRSFMHRKPQRRLRLAHRAIQAATPRSLSGATPKPSSNGHATNRTATPAAISKTSPEPPIQARADRSQKMPINSHNTYLPQHNNEPILNDTYLDKSNREQHVYLYHAPTLINTILSENSSGW